MLSRAAEPEASAGEPAAPVNGTVRVPAPQKLGYGAGNLAYAVPYQATATFLLCFATVILKIPHAWAGIAIAISAVWAALTDPLVGYLSDNTQTRALGRR